MLTLTLHVLTTSLKSSRQHITCSVCKRQYFPSRRALLENLVNGHNDYKLKLVLHPGVNWEWKVLQPPKWFVFLLLTGKGTSWAIVRMAFPKPALKSECTPTRKILEWSWTWQKRTLVLWVDAMRKFRNGQATVKQPWRPRSTTGSPIPGAAPQPQQPIPQLPDTALNHNS